MKKRYTRIIGMVSAAALTGAMLAGCGSSGSSSAASSAAVADSSPEASGAAESEAASVSGTAAEASDTEAVSAAGDAAGALSGRGLSIGCDVSFVPFCFPDENDVYTGFDIDLMDAFADYLGFTYELQPMEFTALLASVQTSKVDLGTAGITITQEREDVMDFSEPYYDAGLQILVRNDSDITDFADLSGKKVATKQGTASVDFLAANVPDADVVEFPTGDEAYLEVSRGAAEAAVFDSPNMLYYCATNPDAGCKVVGTLQDACQYGILFPSGSELTPYFNAALDTFRADGTYDSIYEKWFGSGAE